MKNKLMLIMLATLFISSSQHAQSPHPTNPEVNYTISFDPHPSQYINVEMTCSGLTDSITDLAIPVWAPGYYLILPTPRHISSFEAYAEDSIPLAWRKEGKNHWLVSNGTYDKITVSYRFYANQISVGESHVDTIKAFMPGNELYMHLHGRTEIPATVTFHPRSEWSQISTGLTPIGDNSYQAANIDLLYDSPVLIGNQRVIDFEHEGKQYTLATLTTDGLNEEEFIGDLKTIISESTKLIGHVPYDHYTFMLLGKGRGGLEHFNSQAIFTSGSFNYRARELYIDFLNFVAHEYYHLYNVKTIRPIELGPFDYDRENYTENLWISEGFTCYYECIITNRGGLMSADLMLKEFSRQISAYEQRGGNKKMSVARSSYDIWLNFFNTDMNTYETTISYYNKGPIIGLLTDIEIRRLTNNQRSLDDIMRLLYNRFYLEQDRGFTTEEYWALCEEVCGDKLTEIRRYVETTTPINYEKYFGYAGLAMDKNYQLTHKTEVTDGELAIRNAIFR